MNLLQRAQNRLQWRLIAYLLPLVVVPIVLIAVGLTLQTRASIDSEVRSTEKTRLENDINQLEDFIQTAEEDIRFLSNINEVEILARSLLGGGNPSFVREQVENEFLAFSRSRGIYDQIRFFDIEGNEIVRVDFDGIDQFTVLPAERLQNKADRSYFSETIVLDEGEIYVSPLNLNREGTPPTIEGRIDTDTVVPVIRYGTPIFFDGELAGAIVTNVYARNLLNILVNSIQDLAGEEAFLINQDGFYLVNTTTPETVFGFETDIETVGGVSGTTVANDFPASDLADLANVSSTGDFTDGDFLINYQVIRPPSAPEGYFWVVGLVRDKGILFAEINRISQVVAVATVLLILVVLVLLSTIIRQITEPVAQLSSTAQTLAQGDFSQRVAVQGRADEIGVLGQAFNQMAEEISGFVSGLETRVAERTRDLATTIEVGQMSTNTYLEADFLDRLVEFVRQKFRLYYTQVYLLDDARRYAVLEAGTGEVGRLLLERNHRLDTRETSLVAQAIQNGAAILVTDTKTSDIHKPNDLLPDTRSELAVPLSVRGEIIGVLDMQSSQPETFNRDNQAVFQALANQIATSIRSAQDYQETLDAVARADQINQQITQRTWAAYFDKLNKGERMGYLYDLEAPKPIDAPLNDASDGALQKPISLRGFEIGKIIVAEDDTREWHDDEIRLVNGVAERLSQTLEQMRSADETQFALEQTEALFNLSQRLVGVNTEAEILNAFAERPIRRGVAWLEMYSINIDPMGQPYELVLLADWAQDSPLSKVGDTQYISRFDFASHWVSHPNELLVVTDIADDARVSDTDRQQLQALNIGSFILMPLIFAEQWVGLVAMLWHDKLVFSEADEQFYLSAAPQLASLLETRRLIQITNKRAAELQAVADVSTEATQEQDMQRLLMDVANLTKERFDLYHAHIYLIDETHQNLVLTAGAGRAGQAMVNQGHTIPIDREASIVATAARQKQGIVANDVTRNPSFLPNPLLPATRSEMAVPMTVGGSVIGVLDVQADVINRFTDEDVQIKTTLASQIAIAIQNARSFEQTVRRASEMAVVAQVSAQASSTLDLDQLLKNVARLTRDGFGLYHAHIYLLDTETQNLVLTAGAGEIGDMMVQQGHKIPLKREHSLVARAAREQHGIIANNVQAEPDFLPNPMLPETKSEMAIPIKFRGDVIGVLDVQANTLNHFDDEDVQIKTTLADQIAIAIQNARSFQQTERRAAELEVVAQVSAQASTTLNPTKLLQNVTLLTRDGFGLYHAHIYLLDDDGTTLVLAAGAGEIGKMMVQQGHRIPLNREHSLVARAARTKQGVIANNVQANPDFLPNPMLPETKSEMAIPMIAGNELIGVLDVQANTLNRFDDEDVQIKTTLADQISVAIQNARLYQEQIEVAEQLREVDKLKSEFLASMSHELRTPLNSIIGYAEVILEGIDGPINEEVEEDVDAIYGSGKLLLNLINDILDLAKIEAGQLDLDIKEIEVEDFLPSIIESSRILVKNKTVELNVELADDLPPVCVDHLRMQQVLNNLLSNAAKFTDNGSITVKVEPSDSMVKFSVIDTGIGIEADKIDLVFERFRQADQSSTRKAGGTGLGLAITRELIEMHGGQMMVESEFGKGSTFSFTVPTPETETNGHQS